MGRVAASLLLLVLVGCSAPSIVPEDFAIPTGFETAEFRVRPLVVADAEKDYEAVMASRMIIHAALLDSHWPTESFTLEENREDLARKQRRTERRQSFTYTVVSLDESEVLGCIYINKGINGPQAAVFMWVRDTAYQSGLDPVLEAAVRDWIRRDWPFEWVVYPGRRAPQSAAEQPGESLP